MFPTCPDMFDDKTQDGILANPERPKKVTGFELSERTVTNP